HLELREMRVGAGTSVCITTGWALSREFIFLLAMRALHDENTIMNPIRVTVTGAAGQVAYAMLGRLASGEVFGPTQKLILQLLEITPAMPALEGVAMELDDCSFPTLRDMVLTDDPARAFKDCNWALLVGSFPRKQGMERKELLGINGKIFVGQGRALAANAARDVRILVVGNP